MRRRPGRCRRCRARAPHWCHEGDVPDRAAGVDRADQDGGAGRSDVIHREGAADGADIEGGADLELGEHGAVAWTGAEQEGPVQHRRVKDGNEAVAGRGEDDAAVPDDALVGGEIGEARGIDVVLADDVEVAVPGERQPGRMALELPCRRAVGGAAPEVGDPRELGIDGRQGIRKQGRTEWNLIGREDREDEDALVLDVARRRAVLGAVEETRRGGRDPVVPLGVGQQLERAAVGAVGADIDPDLAGARVLGRHHQQPLGRGTDDQRRPIADNHSVAVAMRIETFAGNLDERAWPALDWGNLVDPKHSNQWC